MVGYRRTHDYPHGKPFPLALLDIVMTALVGLWVFLVPGHWPRAMAIIAVFLVIALISTRLHRHYEQTGEAVRIPRPRVVVRFSQGLPVPMLAVRFAFFVGVAIMVVFGVAPVADSTARIGIIASVFALIGVAVLNLALERHYVNTDHAKEIDVSSSGNV
jgi:uncharacterized membrane protein YhaH (DUF805 family)